MRRTLLPLLSIVVASASAGAQPQHPARPAVPQGWRWHLDAPGRLVLDSTFAISDSTFQLVMMPPGWHVTAGPAMTALDPAFRADGRFALESELFVFPSTKDGEIGVVVGGHELDGPGARWTAFVIRRDGSAAVLRRSDGGTRELVAWKPVARVAKPTEQGAARNVLRVDVDPGRVTFAVNGEKVAELPRADVQPDGAFGLRAGKLVNLHVSRLDLVRPLAPPRP
jgi:hypothetical protein